MREHACQVIAGGCSSDFLRVPTLRRKHAENIHFSAFRPDTLDDVSGSGRGGVDAEEFVNSQHAGAAVGVFPLDAGVNHGVNLIIDFCNIEIIPDIFRLFQASNRCQQAFIVGKVPINQPKTDALQHALRDQRSERRRFALPALPARRVAVNILPRPDAGRVFRKTENQRLAGGDVAGAEQIGETRGERARLAENGGGCGR